jgi:hypothetical protein
MATATAETLDFEVADVTQQRRFHATDVRGDMSVGEVVRSLLPRLGMAARDRAGKPSTYRLRRDRDGRNLFPSERIGDAVRPGDNLTLTHYVQAGASRSRVTCVATRS